MSSCGPCSCTAGLHGCACVPSARHCWAARPARCCRSMQACTPWRLLTEGARQRAGQVDTKPASDILAGAVARAASQSTIHPLDTLKVRMQARGGVSKFGRLVPPAGARHLAPHAMHATEFP